MRIVTTLAATVLAAATLLTLAASGANAAAQWQAPVTLTQARHLAKWDLRAHQMGSRVVVSCTRLTGTRFRCGTSFRYVGPDQVYSVRGQLALRFVKDATGMVVSRHVVRAKSRHCGIHTGTCFTKPRTQFVDRWNATSSTYDPDGGASSS